MPRSVSHAPHKLPANVTLLDFPRTDGHPDHVNWPLNTTKIVDNDGHVNYMRLVSNEEGPSQRWRQAIGTAIAQKQNLPAGNYAISDWPEHYRLYDHNKGPEENPRHDLYLIGSKTVNRFRSIPEFIPHAIWLMGPETDYCACKYCSNSKTQRPISQSLAAAGIRLGSSSPSTPRTQRVREAKPQPLNVRDQKLKPRRAHPYAQVRQKYEPPVIKKVIPMAQDRVTEIRAVNQRDLENPNVPPLYGIYRVDEIVWCQLPHPIACGSGNKEDDIAFWPATITRPYHKSLPVSSDPSSSQNPPSAPWKVIQEAWYEVELLGVSRTKHIEAIKVIPFIAWKAPLPLLDALRTLSPEELHFDDARNQLFDPMPEDGRTLLLSEAASPFSVAIEIATETSRYWTLTDEYEVAPLSLPAPDKGKPLPRPPRPQVFMSQSSLAEVAGISKHMPPERVQEVANNILGIRPEPTAKQTRFQGLWWGSERIWVDDMVRLKPSRCHLAPEGSEHILPPAHLTPLAKQRMMETFPRLRSEDINELSMGAMARAVLLKVHTIMIVNRPSSDSGSKKECRLAGTLYELADEDHDDPPPAGTSSSDLGEAAAPTVLDIPLAPEGYKFRKIQKDGAETVMSLAVVAGRYYPRISSSHPSVNALLRQILYRQQTDDQACVNSSNSLFALEGLTPGFFNSVDPISFKKSRDEMLDHAKTKAQAELKDKMAILMNSTHDTVTEGGSMDVDAET